jgi:hypothetical protein
MPMAAMLPSIVAKTDAMIAITTVFCIALISEPDILPSNRLVYSLRENPVQLPSTLVSVNENMAMIIIGVYSTANRNHR